MSDRGHSQSSNTAAAKNVSWFEVAQGNKKGIVEGVRASKCPKQGDEDVVTSEQFLENYRSKVRSYRGSKEACERVSVHEYAFKTGEMSIPTVLPSLDEIAPVSVLFSPNGGEIKPVYLVHSLPAPTLDSKHVAIASREALLDPALSGAFTCDIEERCAKRIKTSPFPKSREEVSLSATEVLESVLRYSTVTDTGVPSAVMDEIRNVAASKIAGILDRIVDSSTGIRHLSGICSAVENCAGCLSAKQATKLALTLDRYLKETMDVSTYGKRFAGAVMTIHARHPEASLSDMLHELGQHLFCIPSYSDYLYASALAIIPHMFKSK
mmetsp:Transcript_7616/g.19749  ORF Transcript_7616/g.19749 Transcript_7616/m.19749 type:complete len:324 (+) Transcript_7616:77-1048(+)